MPACNGRFGASGGVFSADNVWVTSPFALVRAFAIPPPASSRRSFVCNACSAVFKRIIVDDLGQCVKKSKFANLGLLL